MTIIGWIQILLYCAIVVALANIRRVDGPFTPPVSFKIRLNESVKLVLPIGQTLFTPGQGVEAVLFPVDQPDGTRAFWADSLSQLPWETKPGD